MNLYLLHVSLILLMLSKSFRLKEINAMKIRVENMAEDNTRKKVISLKALLIL